MILFTQESKYKILAGAKWQTRKLWTRPRAKEGSHHLIYLRPPMTGEQPFAKILVTGVRKQKLKDMNPSETEAEGFDSQDQFLEAFLAIHPRLKGCDLGEQEVTVVAFQVAESYDS